MLFRTGDTKANHDALNGPKYRHCDVSGWNIASDPRRFNDLVHIPTCHSMGGIRHHLCIRVFVSIAVNQRCFSGGVRKDASKELRANIDN
jgi:hypothetical protein